MKEDIEDVNWAVPDPTNDCCVGKWGPVDCAQENQVSSHSVDTYVSFVFALKASNDYSNALVVRNKDSCAWHPFSMVMKPHC